MSPFRVGFNPTERRLTKLVAFEGCPVAADPTVKTMLTRLGKFVSRLRSLARSKLTHMTDRWKTLGHDRKSYQKRERLLESSIKRKIQEKSSNS